MAIVSYGTITITDTNDIERIYMVYAGSSSDTMAPDASNFNLWKTDITQVSGDYIWQRTVVKKSGITITSSNFQEYYGDPVCVTGPEGAAGEPARKITKVTPYYYLSTSNSGQTGGSWSDTPAAYPDTGTYYYWTKTVTTYDSGSPTESTPVLDKALNSANKAARDANQTASTTQTNLNNYINSNNANITALQSRLKRIWINENTSGDYVAGTYAASGIDGITFSESNPQTYGYNTLLRHNMLALRYNTINMTALTTNALTFYVPTQQNGNWVQGKKGLEITSSGLSLYNPSNDSISMMDLTSSGLIFKTSAGTEIGKFGSDSSGGLLELSGRLDIKGGGRIGQDSDNYWEFGDNKSYNDEDSAYLIGKGTASIQLGESGHWRIDSNRIHTGWYQLSDSSSSTPAGSLHFDTGIDNGSTYYWDYGMHYPNKAGSGNNKFLYIRRSNDTTSTTLKTIKGRIDDDTYWTYKFWVDGEGNVHAPGFYIGNSTTPIGGGTGTVAERLTQGYGSATQPVYFNSNGIPTTTTYQLNSAGAKGVVTDIANNTSSTNLPTAAAVVSYVTSRGYVTTDKNVQTSQANTTKIYLAGTSTAGTATGTLNYDSNVYLTTTAGTLHATTFDGATFTGTAAKATNDADGNKISTTYLKLSGGTVSGEVEFGSAVSVNDEFYADSITAGNLIVNGAGRFTNGLYGDLTGNVTGSITGNAATADKVNHNLIIKLASGTTEGTNMFTFNGSVAKTVDITKSALGLGNVENKSSATIRGELTSANVTTALGFTPYNSTNPNGYTSNVGTITGVTAGTGLSGGGTSGTVTLGHSNSITAQTTQGIYPIKIDAQGHISAYGSAPTTLSGYGITDAKIVNGVITLGSNTITPLTSQWTANLYVGKAATDKANAAATNGNVYLNLVENSTVRNAHKIIGSGTTTVTSDADGNITISSADSKTGTVTSITLTQGTGITIGSSGTAITTSGSRTIGLADNYGDTKNPYASKTARYVLAAPANAAGAPSFRALTGADVGLGSVLNATQVTGIGQGADGKIRVYKGDSDYEDVAVEIVATESSSVASAQKLTSYGGSTKQPVYFPNSGTNAGKPVAIGYTIETSVPSGAVFTDTTYTFANGTNGFTVTPLNGTAQTVTVTPSIANNVTGSGTSGSLVKWNGANTVTNGPALGTDTTKFLNNKGEWAVPGGTYSLPLAANGTRGGVQIGFTTNAASRNYAVQLSSEKMYVNVPWTDTTYSAGTGLSLTGTTFANTGVTGVKGNSENSYRTGQVNLTAANIGAVGKSDELLTTNPFRPASLSGPYISKIDNAFYAADKRWNVSMTNLSSGTIGNLFDGSYETTTSVTAGETSVITMDFTPSTYFPGYPYGYILISFYYTGVPASVSGRVYCNYSAHGVGWHDIAFSPISDSGTASMVYRSEHQAYYNISQLEITVVGNTDPTTKIVQIEMHLDRPDSSRTPFLSKYGPETLYYSLTAPKFIGDLQGKADKTGDATCILYPMANNEINFGGTGAKNTIYFGYRTTDSKTAPAKYVFSGSTGTASLQCNKVYLNSGTTAYIDGTTYTGNAATATIANKISDLTSSDNASSTTTWRKVWISYNDNATGRPAITDGLTFQTSTNTLRATTFNGALDGNATTATTAGAFTSAAAVTLTGDTTGTASSTKGWSLTTKTDRISTVGDNRTVATTPSSYVNKIIFQGLKTNSSFGAPSTDIYSYVIGLRGWSDNSGGKAHEFAFNDSGINHRSGATTTWDAWEKIITSANYTDYMGDYVTKNSVQNITANKIFSNGIKFTANDTSISPSNYGAVHYDNTLEALVFSFA